MSESWRCNQTGQDIGIYRWKKETNNDFYPDNSEPDLSKICQGGLLQSGCVTIFLNRVRCYKCWRFGHAKFNCRKNEVGRSHRLSEGRKEHVSFAKQTKHQMIKCVQNGKKKRKFKG